MVPQRTAEGSTGGSRISRRAAVKTVAGAFALGAAGAGAIGTVAGQERSVVAEQGEQCVEVTPLVHGGASIEEFYGYTADEPASGKPYSANPPTPIAENGVSVVFLYDDPAGLSLVVIHDATGPRESGGGAASFEFSGLPSSGSWVVRDDPPDESAERWRTDADVQTVDWAWHPWYTDGGAFRGGLDGEFDVEIRPAFNDDAALDPLTPGGIDEWQLLSGDAESPDRTTLDATEPLTLRTGTCE